MQAGLLRRKKLMSEMITLIMQVQQRLKEVAWERNKEIMRFRGKVRKISASRMGPNKIEVR